jgi:diacylglycerol kinase (ATP)
MEPALPSGGNGSRKKHPNKMKQQQFSLRSRLNSFGFAFNGFSAFFRQEPNAWLHLIATLTVFMAAWHFNLSYQEVIALIVVTGFVWVAEIINTAIERIMDFISKEKNADIKLIKDLAASGVLLSAITALVTGTIIFIPKLF